jgi:hypothetical protein
LAVVAVQGLEDSRGELRRATSIDEFEHGVKVDRRVPRQTSGQVDLEA